MKKVLLIQIAVAVAMLCILGAFFSSNKITVARCVVTDNGSLYMAYNDEKPVLLSGKVDGRKFNTGDKLLIVHSTAFAESYPEQTRATLIIRLSPGTKNDGPQTVLDILDGLSAGE